jgi:hypothetical protein
MTKTDVEYDLIEHMEKEKRWMTVVAVVCIILAPLGLWINLKALEIILVRTDRWISVRVVFFTLNLLVSALLAYVGIRQALFISRWNKKLTLIKTHEKKIYEEVMREA